jgi:hypothetical protein
MGRPVTGPLNEAITTHIRMELYHQYQDSRDHHHWSKDMDHTLRYNAHRAAPFKSKHSRTHGHRTTTSYKLFNDKYTTLGVKARRAGESVEHPCLWCPNETENTNHIITRCRQPTVVHARRLFLNKQRYAIATSKLTFLTRKALSALYSIQHDGTMATLAYPSEHQTKQVVDKIIEQCARSQEPLRDFYYRLWQMDASDRALSWIRRDWIFELTKIPGNTVEEAEKLAIKLIQNSSQAHDIWRARCAAIRAHPEGDPVERRNATIQYETELRRTRRKNMPIPLEQFQKKSWHQRQRLLQGWINLPSVEITALKNWLNGKPRPEPNLKSAPDEQPDQTPNLPINTNNESLTLSRRPRIDKRKPLMKPVSRQPVITSFYMSTSQGRAATSTTLPTALPPLSTLATPRYGTTPPTRKRKTTSTTIPSAEPKKRIKETSQEALARRRHRVDQEYYQATNHGKIINLQLMTHTPPRQRVSTQPKGHPRTKLAVGEQVPPKVYTQAVDVDVS